jgi:hypothetical protein
MADLHNGKWWWAYLDTDGVIRVLPYTNDRIIAHTERLRFCAGIFDPFYAVSKHQAQMKIAAFLAEQQEKEKVSK